MTQKDQANGDPGSTYFAHTHIDDAGGRFAATNAAKIVGQDDPAIAAAYPACSPALAVQLPDEPPLGFDNPALESSTPPVSVEDTDGPAHASVACLSGLGRLLLLRRTKAMAREPTQPPRSMVICQAPSRWSDHNGLQRSRLLMHDVPEVGARAKAEATTQSAAPATEASTLLGSNKQISSTKLKQLQLTNGELKKLTTNNKCGRSNYN